MKNLEIIGSMCITNNLALEVYNYESDTNKIIYKYSDECKFRKARLYENTKGIYFNTPMGRMYLDEIMRVNW